MVTLALDTGDDSSGLPVRPPVGDWVTTDESPVALAARGALAGLLDGAQPLSPDDPVSVRRYVSAATMPLGNLYRELRTLGFPASDYLGAEFARRVGGRALLYYQRRNTASLIVELAADARFRYVLSWTPPTGGPRTALNVCVTPTVLRTASTGWAEFVTEWLEWSYPYFEGGGIVVTICPEARTTLELAPLVSVARGGVVRYT